MNFFLISLLVVVAASASVPQLKDGHSFQPKLDLPSLKSYLKWLPRFGNNDFIVDFGNNFLEMIGLQYDVKNTYDLYMDESQDFFESKSIYDDFDAELLKSFTEFTRANNDFWRAWLYDYENIQIHFPIFLNRLSPLLSAVSKTYLALNYKMDDFAHVFLPPTTFIQLDTFINETLVTVTEKCQILNALLNAPSPNNSFGDLPLGRVAFWALCDTKMVTLADIMGIVEWFGKLDASEIIGGYVNARALLKEVNANFSSGLYEVLREGGGMEIEDEARNIIEDQKIINDSLLRVFNQLFKRFLTLWYNGDVLDALYLLDDLELAGQQYFTRSPTFAVEAIEKLEQLVYSLDAEIVQKAQVLLDEALGLVEEIVQDYLSNWKLNI